MFSWSLMILLLAMSGTAFKFDDQLQTDKIIETVNAAKTTWKAGRNFHKNVKKSYVKNLLGAINEPIVKFKSFLKVENDDNDNLYTDIPELPLNFDAREKWKFCASLQEVRDQGSCGSCWAVSTASAFTDRLCIATNGSFNGHLSAQHVLSCCHECGDGCEGGNPIRAWIYFETDGLVSGGDFESKEGCQPYTFPECEHYVSGPRDKCRKDHDYLPTPPCKLECYNNKYKGKFEEDLHRVESAFILMPGMVADDHNLFLKLVQQQIYENGPVTTAFEVYEDFLAYKSGVYQYTTGNLTYGHAVKVIGWGEENGTPYWLVSNSWNSDWGDKGFFKIKRGNNECGFEDVFYGGILNI